NGTKEIPDFCSIFVQLLMNTKARSATDRFTLGVIPVHCIMTMSKEEGDEHTLELQALIVAAAEPFEEPLILSVEDRVGPNKDDVFGSCMFPLQYVERRMAPSGSNALYFDVHHDECDLEVGLKIIERDSDVAAMYDFVDSYGKLNMFMSHIHQNLTKIYFQNINMEESGDEATSRLRIHEIMVKDASNMSYDELVSWAEDEAEMQTPKKKVVTPKKKLVEHVVDVVATKLIAK
ncbi:hypothetical protein Tco_0355484, partial [Tanacetum coccineum]